MNHEQPLVENNFHPSIGGYTDPDRDGVRPDGMPTRDECTHIATDYDSLKHALGTDNAVVYIGADIDVTYEDVIWCGDNVTLVGQYCDPSVSGMGYRIHYDEHPIDGYTGCIRAESGTPPTFYGVFMQGPLREFVDDDHTAADFEDGLRSGVWVSTERDDGLCEIIGCRFSGWTWAGVVIGDHGQLTEANVHRSTLDMNNYNHYGYGISQRDGDLWVDRCFFDDNRHHTAGYGHPTEYTDITNSVGGPGPGASHSWDKHEADFLSPDDQYRVAGAHLRMQHCTTMCTEGIFGGIQEGVKIRGVTDDISWIRDCHFYHTEPPSKTNPDQRQAIRQETHEWINFQIFDDDEYGGNNYYGTDSPPAGVGAPLAPDPPTKPLAIHGPGHKTDYEITLYGDATTNTLAETSENVIDTTDEMTTITGRVVGGTDTFELSQDAQLWSLQASGPIDVTLNGEPIDTAPLIAAAEWHRTDRVGEDYSDELSTLRQSITNLSEKVDSAEIVFK